MNLSSDKEMSEAMNPWDGSRWFVPKPASGWRLASMSQATAKQLLRPGNRLSNWDARFLQTVLVQTGPLDAGQRYWMNRIAEALGEREAA